MSQGRILIVEDETIVAMDIAATVRRLGYDVVGMVGTGAAAIESARLGKPDLILMDIRLKGPMDGIEAATVIQREGGVPIVFLTAHADIDTLRRSKAAAPYGYLIKPFDETSLQRIVEITLGRVHADRGAHEQTLDALWQSEEKFRLLVDAVQDYALIAIDLDKRVVSWNPGAERMTGYHANEIIGRSLALLRAAEGNQDLDVLLDRVRHAGAAEWDSLAVRKDGTHYLAHVYCARLRDRKGELAGYVAVARDVTEQRSLEAQLAQAQRLESLGQLAGGIAHDFNNMLMVIMTRCDLLLRSLEQEKLRQYVYDIRTAANKNRDLTHQLLAAARQQVLEPEVVDVNDVVESVMRLLEPTLGENITILRHLHPALWFVDADPGKLHQVLVNLAINARDAMPDGGVLTIETRNVHVDASYARQHIGMRDGDYVSLVVSDTGVGIPVAIRDRIYDPFFTTKPAGRGTGLGLAVVRGIVEQTGGRIWMYTEEGRGTAFKIFLPRHIGRVEPHTAVEEMNVDRGSETILLVEDEELLRSVVREAMEEHGYRVLEARTPAEAVQISKQYDGTIDLLLTDMIMPGMTGRELAEKLRDERRNMCIIFMSGYTNHSVVTQETLPANARFLEKPIATTHLLRVIRTTLDEKPSARGTDEK